MNCGTCKHWGRAERADERKMLKHGFGKCAIWGEGLTDSDLIVEARNVYVPKTCVSCKFIPSRWESDTKEAA